MKKNILDHPLMFAALCCYILCGLSLVSVFINLLHTKFSRQYWLPGNAYMPLIKKSHICDTSVATIENEEGNTYIAEPSTYRYTTLGIFQGEVNQLIITKKYGLNLE